MERIAIREVTRSEVLLVHAEDHWDRVRATGCEPSLSPSLVLISAAALAYTEHFNFAVQTAEYLATCSEYFERLSLYINEHSAYAARLSCGGVIEMCRAVAEGTIRNGFAIVR